LYPQCLPSSYAIITILSRNLINDILGAKYLLSCAVELQLVKLQLLANAGCILLGMTSTLGCLAQPTEVLGCTALGCVRTVELCLEALGSDDEKGIDLTNLIVTGDETGKEVASGTFL